MSRSQSSKNATLLSKRGTEKNYKIFAVNFHGKYLDPIRLEFTKMGYTHQRRRVIVIDMDTEQRRRSDSSKNPSLRGSPRKRKTKSSAASSQVLGPQDLLGAPGVMLDNILGTIAIKAIQRLQREYDETSMNIAKEREFNLLEYWQETLNKAISTSKRKSLSVSKSIDRDLKKKRLPTINENEEIPRITCLSLIPQPHNKIGKAASILKTKFIEDEPPDTKLFIILIGKFDNDFYFDLLRRGEPLQAIIDFLPAESSYDLLVPNPLHKTFVANTIEELQSKIYELRKKPETKPTGIFRNFLPKISDCLALKYASTIYDQLSWAFYDMELLYRNYIDYYLVPFRETNVAMPQNVSLQEAFYVTEALDIQGNYLKSPFPAVIADTATAILYMDMLFNTIARSDHILTEWETILLSTPLPKRIYAIYADSVNTLSSLYSDAFHSITKMKKVERLFVEANNQTFSQMVQYVDHELFRHIYLACLEYKIQRKYINNNYHRHAVPYHNYKSLDIEDFELPGFAKLYATDDGIIQRLLALLDDFDNYDVLEIRPGHKLYQFTRNLNEIIEHNRMFTIPTRLCFRDFTLFQMEEFLAELVTLEMSERISTKSMSNAQRFEYMMRRLAQDYNPDIFIRPLSLKARRAATVSSILGLNTLKRRGTHDSARERELQMAADALMSFSTRASNLGIPKQHPMLQGYNLEDIRQEIWVKTSKYYFEEGHLTLYEERVNFTDTNKNLNLKINGNKIILDTPRASVLEIKPQFRVISKNEVTVRLDSNPSECAQIVLNYPNGLTVYYQEKHTEQVWSIDGTPNNEKRRLLTPHGAVIVFYHSEDMILVMRYNGEIFRLYQYEFVFSEGEAEEGGSTNTDQSTDVSTRSKTIFDILQKESQASEKTDRSERSRIPPEARPIKIERKKKRISKKRAPTDQVGDPGTFSMGSSLSLGSYISDRETDQKVIADELSFLHQLMAYYDLSYKHLIVTTSVGRVFNLTHYGKFYETMQIKNEEWHDYFVDESYAMRDDGVRMIWGIDYFKCYHADGTVIISDMRDILHNFDFFDEFAEVISESSSHKNFEEQSETIGDGVKSNIIERSDSLKRLSAIGNKKKSIKSYEPYLKTLGEGEEEGTAEFWPIPFVCVVIGTQRYHHHNYACVYFLPQSITYEAVTHIMEIKGADDIVIQRAREALSSENQTPIQDTEESTENVEESKSVTVSTRDSEAAGDSSTLELARRSSSKIVRSVSILDDKFESLSKASKLLVTSPQTSSSSFSLSLTQVTDTHTESIKSEIEHEEEILVDVLKVWIGTDFYIVASVEGFELQAMIQRHSGRHKEKTLEKIKFKIAFADNLQEVFQLIVAQIASFKKYHAKKTEELFFLEKTTRDCSLKALEFMENLPDLGEYQLKVGNTYTQFTKLTTILEKFSKTFDWYESDMAKFPRFHVRTEKHTTALDDFPMVLNVNLFMKIPALLHFTNEIHKFMEPLDLINFKKTRHQIKETMNNYIYPDIKTDVKKYASQVSWQLHHEEQTRRKLIEAQRTGLYHAMLRHKTYPKYHLFQEKYNGKAECIDYFDFCLLNCKGKSATVTKSGKKSPPSKGSSPRQKERSANKIGDQPSSQPSTRTSQLNMKKEYY